MTKGLQTTKVTQRHSEKPPPAWSHQYKDLRFLIGTCRVRELEEEHKLMLPTPRNARGMERKKTHNVELHQEGEIGQIL